MEETPDVDLEGLGDVPQSPCGDAVYSKLVLLDLLKRYPEGASKLLLGQAKLLAALADPQPYMAVNIY